MLQVQNLHKSYGITTVLAGISLIVNDGEHVGLIGPNGAGKSTLLRCIIGQEQPDSGTITLSPPARRSAMCRSRSAICWAIARSPRWWPKRRPSTSPPRRRWRMRPRRWPPPQIWTQRWPPMTRRWRASRRWAAMSASIAPRRCCKGWAWARLTPSTPASTLSGGQKTRLGLATLLLREPDLLLLDEPTNHLDVEALEWLEGFVRGYRGAVLIVSHDREFLDQTVTRILYLDPETHTVKSYTGNYSDFAEAREHERELHAESWKKQQEYVDAVESDIARLKGQALGVELSTTPAQPTIRRYAKKVAQESQIARAQAGALPRIRRAGREAQVALGPEARLRAAAAGWARGAAGGGCQLYL